MEPASPNANNMKLHLGCGERHLDGYLNIDYPSAEHTVQTKSVADQFADITAIKYESDTIDEVRLHHVFEHFSRAQACALVAAWHGWLKAGGVLHLEVPNFRRTALAILSPFVPFKEKMVGIRHIFGSQEARWAVHLDGYCPARLKKLLTAFGFEVVSVEKNSYKGTYNLEIIAKKASPTRPKEEHAALAEQYLSQFCLDDSPTEKSMLGVWLKEFSAQLSKSI